MPFDFDDAPPPRRATGGGFSFDDDDQDEGTPDAFSTGRSLLPTLLGAGAIGALALALRKPGLAKKSANMFLNSRQQSMLSGFALGKSGLGNVGAAGNMAIERRSLDPLKQLFSRQTIQDAKAAWKAGTPSQYGDVMRVPKWSPIKPGAELWTPGRAMGALDDATQKALVRAGATADEAAEYTLQTPLSKEWTEALDNPVARYMVPFRRTPVNGFLQGMKAFKGEHKVALGGYMGAGAVHGAATADTDFPVSIGFGGALAGKYQLPYYLGALVGRMAGGARDTASLAAQALPVSEFSIASGIQDPLQPFREPAALRALRQMTSGRTGNRD